MTTEIHAGSPIATFINVFTVAPEQQQKALDLLVEATEEHISALPGFISANFHVSKDRTHIVNYAQWETQEALNGMLQDPVCAEHIGQVAAIAEYEAYFYDVHSTHAKR